MFSPPKMQSIVKLNINFWRVATETALTITHMIHEPIIDHV